MADEWARDIALPFRFDADCDLVQETDHEVVDHALNIIAFTPNGTVILFNEMGCALEASVFEMMDEETRLIIDTSLRTAFESQEPRIYLDKEMVFDESPDEKTLFIIVPYKIKVNGELTATKFIVPRLLNR